MKKRKQKRTWTLTLVGALLMGAVWAAVYGVGFGDESQTAIQGATVKRGSLRISVVERGNLKAANSVTLKSEIEGQTTILYLIEEGADVQPGDLLCELDVSSLEDKRVEQEISLQNREAEYVKAQQNYEIQKSQNQSDIAKADRELGFSRLDLAKYMEGDKPQQLQKAEEDILVADEELTRARQDLEWSEKLAKKGFLEQTELDADRLAETRSEVRLNQMQRALTLLQNYEFPRQIAELEADVTEAERELERVKLQAKARIADYEAGLRTSKARFDLEQRELEEIDEQIGKARLEAPVAGMVVYAVENRGRWGGGEPMQEGRMVRERQEIITIPSADGFLAEVSLHESVLEKVRISMPCIVTVDAIEDRTFSGTVKFKALLPDQQSYFANPDLRVYRSEVQLVEADPRIRPGMSCSIEILVDEIEDTLVVPVQAVFLNRGKPVCFVIAGGDIEKRPVQAGQNNGKQVEISSGLSEGEVVMLSQPAGFTLEPAVDEADSEGEDPWNGRKPPARAGGKTSTGGGAPTAHATEVKPAPDGEARPASTPVAVSRPTEAGAGTEGGWAGGNITEEQREAWRKRMEADPEAAARFREQMEKMRNDPEAMERFRKMRERGGAGGGGHSGGGAPAEGTPQGSQ